MKRKLSILFVFLLLFQSLNYGFVTPMNIKAEETNEDIITNVSFTDEDGQQLQQNSISKSQSALMKFDWMILDSYVEKEQTSYTYEIPEGLSISEKQIGILEAEDERYGSYVAEGTTVTITLTELTEETVGAEGTFTIKVNGKNVEESQLENDAFDEEAANDVEKNKAAEEANNNDSSTATEIEDDEDAANKQENQKVTEEVKSEVDEIEKQQSNEKNTEGIEDENQDTAQDVSSTETDTDETILNKVKRLFGFGIFNTNSEKEITENIITDVTLTLKDQNDDAIDIDPGKPIRIEDPYNQYKVNLKYDFKLPDGHGYKKGATYNIELPNMLRIDNRPDPTALRDENNEVFGHFTVKDNIITIVFNELIEEKSNIAGYIEAESEFLSSYNGEADTDLTFPISGGQTIEFPIQFIPKGSSIDKRGIGDKGYNTETIEWTIDFNKDFQEIQNATLADQLTDGDQDYIANSIKVYKLNLNADGTVASVGDEVPGNWDQFPLALGDIDSPHRVVYETKVNDRIGTTYKNEVTLAGDNISEIKTGATVTVTRGTPLDKNATNYNNVTQIIEWEVKYNYDEKEINQEKAKLTDTLGDKQALIADSFEVFEVSINQDTGAEEGTTQVASNAYTVVETQAGFELQFNSNIDKAYKIIYQTEASERIFDNFNVINTIEDEFENSDSGGQTVSQGIFIKSHDGNPDYNSKETSWTVLINRDEQTMKNVVFTDVLPEGMTPNNVAVSHGGSSLSEGTDYTFNYNNTTRTITIRFLNDITERVYITYKTDIDYDVVNWENVSFANNAFLEWIPENETISVSKAAAAVFTPDEYTQHNGFKGGSYNPVTKEITWTIGVNYNKADLKGVKVTDYIQGGQNFDIANVKVYNMILTGGEYGYEKGTEISNPNVTKATGPNNEPGFLVNLGDIDSPYLIEFTTNLNDQLIVSNYDNVASVTTTNRGNSELEAKVEPVHGGEYTKKSAEQNNDNPRVINWNIDINFTQSTVNNVEITDTPSINQAIRKDSFVLYGTTVTESGLKKNPNMILTEGTHYNLTFTEDADGQETFTLEIPGKTETGYVLEYDTYILYTGGEHDKIVNNATFSANENIPGETDFQFDDAINLSSIGGGITGQVGSLEVTKVDADDASILLEGAMFELYDETGEVLLRTAETDTNGVAEFKNLLFGDYILKETKAPDHYVVGIIDQQTVTVDNVETDLVVKNEKIKQHFELTKVDDKDRTPLEGVKFELYQGTPPSGTKVLENLTTNEQGKILIEHLPGGNADDGIPAGDYYLKETATLPDYELLSDPIEFTIEQDQTVVTKQTVSNRLIPGSFTFTKNDTETNAQLGDAVFNLIYISYNGNTYNEQIRQITTDATNATVVDDLRPGEYKLEEVTAPIGYEKLTTDITFTIDKSQATTLDLGQIDNDVKTTNILLTKSDSRVANKTLAGAQFEITYQSGDYAGSFTSYTETTDASGQISFDALKPGTYHITETVSPEGYILDSEPIEVEVTLNNVHNNQTITRTAQNDPFVDVILEKRNTEDTLLQGAVFDLIDRDTDAVIDTLTTGSNGQIRITGLPAGNYKLVETASPDGYQNPVAGDAKYERDFEVLGTETQTNEYRFINDDAVINDIVKGSLEITKVDIDDGTILPNVEFTLQSVSLVDGGPAYLQTGITTGPNGKVTVDDLWPGTYKLTETKAADGYQLHWKEIDVTINKSDTKHEAEVTIENYQLVDVPVTKNWNDNDDAAGVRPTSIMVDLYRSDDLTTPHETAEIKANEGWKYTFTGLDAVDSNGNKYEYSVVEQAVVNYAKQGAIQGDSQNPQDGFTITNVVLTDIIVNKNWEDDNDATGDRPTALSVQLKRGNDTIDTTTLTANDWTHTFTNLPVYDANGDQYEYSVEETVPSGYELKGINRTEENVTTTFDITNVRTAEIDINVTKDWKDEPNTAQRPAAGITVDLFQKLHDAADFPVTPYRTKTITPTGNDWKLDFEKLPQFDESGKEYVYEVKERPVAGYTSTVTENNGNFIITNVRTGTTSISGEKIWKHDDGTTEPAIDVQLYQNGNLLPGKVETVSESTNWKYEFTGLDEFDHEGIPYTYTVDEVTIPTGYKKEVDGTNIINTRTGTTSVKVFKSWLDDDSPDRPNEISVNLLQNGVDYISNQEIKASEDWEFEFTNLPAFDADGKAYTYTVEEVVPNGYEQVSNVTNADGSITITNRRIGETEVAGTKTWNDANNQDGVRPKTITVNLLANGTQVDFTEVEEENGEWKYSFTNLDKYDDQGVEIEYTVTENTVEHYSTEINNFDITNRHTPFETSVTVTKAWDDANDQDGIRPNEIEVQLIGDDQEVGVPVTLSEANNWTHTWTELPLNAAGEAVKYTVIEVTDVTDYTVTIDDTNHGNIIMTNIHIPEEIEIPVTKTWNDADNQDGKRPESIQVILLADGQPYRDATLTADTNWEFTFENLPKNDQGVEIEYTIEEVAVAEYETMYEGFAITNSYTPETITVEGKKIWQDDNDAKGMRPKQITVNLLANGEQVNSIVVTEADSWEYQFVDLPKYEAGIPIEYTITENEVAGYETTIEGFNITNILIETPVDESGKDKTEESLPNTAMNIYNWLLVGAILFITGLATIFMNKRSRRNQSN